MRTPDDGAIGEHTNSEHTTGVAIDHTTGTDHATGANCVNGTDVSPGLGDESAVGSIEVAQSVEVAVGAADGYAFDPAELSVPVGTRVVRVWTKAGGPHDIVARTGFPIAVTRRSAATSPTPRRSIRPGLSVLLRTPSGARHGGRW